MGQAQATKSPAVWKGPGGNLRLSGVFFFFQVLRVCVFLGGVGYRKVKVSRRVGGLGWENAVPQAACLASSFIHRAQI